MGWSATFASLSVAPILLYASAFAWTIGYDTIYALQDARDDAIVGIRSTARLFGTRVKLGVAAFYIASAALALAAIESAGGGAIARVGWMGFCAHLAWQTSQVEGADPASALRLFRSNRDAGLILFAGITVQGWFG